MTLFIFNIILNILLIILFPFVIIPVLLIKKYRVGMMERLGFIKPDVYKKIKTSKIIWFHAASVGEAQALIPVINEMKKLKPDYEILATTTSVNGKNKLKTSLDNNLFHVCLLPFDVNFIINNFVKRIKPEIVVIVETELWPNLITAVSNRGIPLVMVNGRISIKSFKTYRTFKFFFKSVIEKFDMLVMQSEKMVVRLRVMGIDKGKMIMVRNTKFSSDTNNYTGKVVEFNKKGKKIIIAGSIRKDEEKTVIVGCKNMIMDSAVLVLAPRRMNRLKQIEEILKDQKLSYTMWSALKDYNDIPNYNVIVVDTVGELQYIYKMGDVAIIGGGFKKYGGHNPMEAAINSMPLIMGKNMYNFEDTSDRFVKGGGAFMIEDSYEVLEEKLELLISNGALAYEMGLKNKNIVENFRGTAATTALLVNEVLIDRKKVEK